ncbi:hypothetical protein FB595_1385 [Sphingobium sp. AEW010]|nr:hypothetical protein [Sphingobium sp. JAI105]TWC97200.1 hypothetical protein FB595_1385 [Sphingobium sp. AEW010]TWD17380.1 hypothetical protein FB596_1395 [Sphingobium sp. AEW013]TWD19902.1 hypothetical protein FB594_1395 [Sphingobium sp. AEW001]
MAVISGNDVFSHVFIGAAGTVRISVCGRA